MLMAADGMRIFASRQEVTAKGLAVSVRAPYRARVATHSAAMEAQQRARAEVPEIIRTFMRITGVSQAELGEALGLTQTQVSRRLSVGSLSHDELAGIAAYFGVTLATFEKPGKEAIRDLLNVGMGCFRRVAGQDAA